MVNRKRDGMSDLEFGTGARIAKDRVVGSMPEMETRTVGR
jgi:hypothetical protein